MTKTITIKKLNYSQERLRQYIKSKKQASSFFVVLPLGDSKFDSGDNIGDSKDSTAQYKDSDLQPLISGPRQSTQLNPPG